MQGSNHPHRQRRSPFVYRMLLRVISVKAAFVALCIRDFSLMEFITVSRHDGVLVKLTFQTGFAFELQVPANVVLIEIFCGVLMVKNRAVIRFRKHLK